jgi:SWI/SNF-related matrix-associated actin-dependent regulator of chromatin subfamily A member 5
VAWLAAQHSAGAGGGILGDDMGLGKTLQVLSFLQYLRDAKVGRCRLTLSNPS